MELYIVPVSVKGFERENIVIRMRKGEDPVLFMKDVEVTSDGLRNDGFKKNDTAIVTVMGVTEDNVGLEDGDVLMVNIKHNNLLESIKVNVEKKDDIYISENTVFNPISIAARMEETLCICIADIKYKNTVSTAVQVFNKTMKLYEEYPAFKDIMIKDDEGVTKEVTLLNLIMTQDDGFVKWAENMLLSMDPKFKTLFPVGKQILEQSRMDKGFTLLSKEEQVAAFLEFSKRHAEKAKESVPDTLLEYLKKSPEYAGTLTKMKQAGLGVSPTQQFNVLQQVGYLGGALEGEKRGSVIYNLSDMGAGKTLMTVQAIYMMDCISIGIWNRRTKNENVKVESVYTVDKHIIAPALSVKASWVDTFRLFYDVEKVDDYHYVLRIEYGGTTAESHLHIAPFTVRSGKVFVQQTLPESKGNDTFLIIDEIHQLVKRRISRTKFFPSKTVPMSSYRIFVLSGTMSNLKAGEWLSMIRFLGETSMFKTATESGQRVDLLNNEYKTEISEIAGDLESLQHRKFNVDNINEKTHYDPLVKKKSMVDKRFFMEYGSKLLIPRSADEMRVQDMLANKRFIIDVEPEESDNVSFELFYRIAATSAITAQSLQVAEELFGEQATQHKSSIIKTMSPFTDEEILLLDTLHKIAADANKYRSANIGRDINNAILNLNDGLQQKDLYTLVAGFADRNTKFLEYLAGLDVNVLERLPKTGLIRSPKLTNTHKFHVLKELLEKDKDETFLIVVNDYYAMKTLADALGVSCLTKQELKDEMAYQELLDGLFEKQSIVIVTQDMIKSSLDLVQANRLVQYQLNTEVSDIIQTQNRINRIGQTRETKCYYIAADRLQNTLIELFLNSYRNIRVAHKGIVELFADLSSQIDIINDYLDVAFKKLGEDSGNEEGMVPDFVAEPENNTDLVKLVVIPRGYRIQSSEGRCSAILFPEKEGTGVIVPLRNGNPFRLGLLKPGVTGPVTAPTRAVWDINEMKLVK